MCDSSIFPLSSSPNVVAPSLFPQCLLTLTLFPSPCHLLDIRPLLRRLSFSAWPWGRGRMTSIHRSRDAGCCLKMRQKAEEGRSRSVAVSNPPSTSLLLRRHHRILKESKKLISLITKFTLFWLAMCRWLAHCNPCMPFQIQPLLWEYFTFDLFDVHPLMNLARTGTGRVTFNRSVRPYRFPGLTDCQVQTVIWNATIPAICIKAVWISLTLHCSTAKNWSGENLFR